MRLSAPADAHPSVHKLARRIVEADKEARTTPLKFQPIPTPDDLPDAADWPGSTVFVTSLGTLAISDGTDWFPVTIGAAL